MTEAEYFTKQIQELRRCYEWVDAYQYSLLKGKNRAYRSKVAEEIAFQESVSFWIGTIRRDGKASVLKAMKVIVKDSELRGLKIPKTHMRSFYLGMNFDNLDPHITERFPV